MPKVFAAERSFISDEVTPIGAYRALRERQASCLLESVERGTALARYSFIARDYRAVRTFCSSGTLLAQIRDFVRNAAAPLTVGNFPAAAIIACAYDAARSFARLPERKATFPSMPDVYMAVPATWIIFDHLTHRATIHTVDELESVALERAVRYEREIFSARSDSPSPAPSASGVEQSMSREQYVRLAERVKQHILDGDVYQLQLGVRFAAQFTGEGLDLYRRLRSRNPSPYMFHLDTPFGELLGASPEFLVRVEKNKARIRPLAGTRSRGTTPEEDARAERELLSSEKERAEHVMLVDLARNDLGMVCRSGSIVVGELLEIERYSHVMHLVSDLVGEVENELDALDVFFAAFPAGTVTGTPKIRAMQLIDEYEPVNRGFYAGSIGRLEVAGSFDSCITLRSMHLAQGRACWQASAGIVADSDPAEEYAEVLHKTAIIREALGLSR